MIMTMGGHRKHIGAVKIHETYSKITANVKPNKRDKKTLKDTEFGGKAME